MLYDPTKHTVSGPGKTHVLLRHFAGPSPSRGANTPRGLVRVQVPRAPRPLRDRLRDRGQQCPGLRAGPARHHQRHYHRRRPAAPAATAPTSGRTASAAAPRSQPGTSPARRPAPHHAQPAAPPAPAAARCPRSARQPAPTAAGSPPGPQPASAPQTAPQHPPHPRPRQPQPPRSTANTISHGKSRTTRHRVSARRSVGRRRLRHRISEYLPWVPLTSAAPGSPLSQRPTVSASIVQTRAGRG